MTPPEEPSPPPPGWEESDGEDSSDELEQEYFRLVYAGIPNPNLTPRPSMPLWRPSADHVHVCTDVVAVFAQPLLEHRTPTRIRIHVDSEPNTTGTIIVYAGYQKKKDAAELGGQMHDMLAKHVCKLHAVAAMLEGRGKPGQRVLLSRPFRADMLQLRHDSQLQHRRDKLTPKQ
eukprot:TRINITY_DN1249_c0_g2_i6.p1 TRINITY_DN1249_c0_g2~~TRINITY_DN1249_c0_g2_i6.p1  ORF type:complete len:174 (+),score=20.44 TRINITY_DN1249_c0_g2_i6:496-1017(+)